MRGSILGAFLFLAAGTAGAGSLVDVSVEVGAGRAPLPGARRLRPLLLRGPRRRPLRAPHRQPHARADGDVVAVDGLNAISGERERDLPRPARAACTSSTRGRTSRARLAVRRSRTSGSSRSSTSAPPTPRGRARRTGDGLDRGRGLPRARHPRRRAADGGRPAPMSGPDDGARPLGAGAKAPGRGGAAGGQGRPVRRRHRAVGARAHRRLSGHGLGRVRPRTRRRS